MKKKKVYLIAGISAAVILVAGVSIYAYAASSSTEEETVYKETTVEKGNLTVGVTESGSVTIGTLTQDIDFEESSSSSTSSSGGMTTSAQSSSSASLYVEEVYVSVGQEVSEGDAILKLTDDSVEDYRSTLESAVEEASASVSEAELSAAKQKLEASYSYEMSVTEGSVAEEEYETTLAELQEAVDEAQQAVDDSASLIYYYQAQISNGIDFSEDLASEQENYEKLCTKLKSAQNTYTTKAIEAKKTYEEALLAASNADSQYSVDVSGVDDEISDAQEALEEAQEALEEFEEFVGDGIIYAEYTGTIMEVGYSAGDTISSSTSVAVFADDTSVTMEVSVSQEDISDISIGDAVNIELNAYEDREFEGEVYSMDTSVSSGSSTVSYSVVVVFTGDISGVYTDMTGNVTFIQKQVEDVLYVSNKAIINDGTVSYVKVKDSDGNIEQVQVITGFSDGVNVEIQSGLEEGETVLIESKVTT